LKSGTYVSKNEKSDGGNLAVLVTTSLNQDKGKSRPKQQSASAFSRQPELVVGIGVPNKDDTVPLPTANIKVTKDTSSNEKSIMKQEDETMAKNKSNTSPPSIKTFQPEIKVRCIPIESNTTIESKFSTNNSSGNGGYTWVCNCEKGFLPPGLLKNFGGLESMLKMGSGQCYHKTK